MYSTCVSSKLCKFIKWTSRKKLQFIFLRLPLPLSLHSTFHTRELYQGLALSDKTDFWSLHFQSPKNFNHKLGIFSSSFKIIMKVIYEILKCPCCSRILLFIIHFESNSLMYTFMRMQLMKLCVLTSKADISALCVCPNMR